MTATEVDMGAIAASLSKAEKRLLNTLPCAGGPDFKAARGLISSGLAHRNVGGRWVYPTYLGIRLRNHMKECVHG